MYYFYPSVNLTKWLFLWILLFFNAAMIVLWQMHFFALLIDECCWASGLVLYCRVALKLQANSFRAACAISAPFKNSPIYILITLLKKITLQHKHLLIPIRNRVG